MSLINDALKKAQKAQARTGPTPQVGPPLQPALEQRRSSRGILNPGMIAALGAIALTLGLGMLWWGRSPAPEKASPTAQSHLIPAHVESTPPKHALEPLPSPVALTSIQES